MNEADALPRHRGTRAIQRMVEYAPSTGGLALWVHHRDLPADAAAPAVATDGATVFYASAFERLSLAEQAGQVAHEVLHIALRHTQRYMDLQRLLGNVDLQLFNLCADAIVNSALAHLGWLRLPASAVYLDRLLAQVLDRPQEVDQALLEWDVERLYRAVDDRTASGRSGSDRAQAGQTGGSGSGRAGSSGATSNAQAESARASAFEDGPRSARARALAATCPVDLVPDPDTTAPPEVEAEHTREWSERLLRAHAGDGAYSMLRSLIADLPRTRTPWQQVLRRQLARGLAPKPSPSWSRPTRSYIANQGRAGPGRRMPWEPGFASSRPAPRLAVIVDVSGSIDDAMLAAFAREIEAIARRVEAGLVLIVGDDRVRRVVHFEPGRADLGDLRFDGRGGTDFTPLLEEADGHRPDIAVVLTDLDGPARFRPRWPVIWAVPASHENSAVPFGRMLVID